MALALCSLRQEFTTPSGVPFHVFIAKAADGTPSILEEVGWLNTLEGFQLDLQGGITVMPWIST